MIVALLVIWVIGAVAGGWYAVQRNIPWPVALAALPAFLIEIGFYYTLGVEGWRTRLEKKLPPWGIAIALTFAAAVPYTIASLSLKTFEWQTLGIISALAAVAAFWYVLLPHRPASDLLFLVFMAVMVLTRIFRNLYVSPHPKLPLYTLGQLMWIRTGAFALLSVRRVQGVGFGFWPGKREWGIGALYFAALVPVTAGVAWLIGFGRPHLPTSGWEKTPIVAVATFFGILWVVALGEEFFFRGLLQQWLGIWLHQEWAGLILASLLFGSVHLWFQVFPNWRLAVLAAVAGVFYGVAFRHAKSIRASMVTHALTVTTWRIFFS